MSSVTYVGDYIPESARAAVDAAKKRVIPVQSWSCRKCGWGGEQTSSTCPDCSRCLTRVDRSERWRISDEGQIFAPKHIAQGAVAKAHGAFRGSRLQSGAEELVRRANAHDALEADVRNLLEAIERKDAEIVRLRGEA